MTIKSILILILFAILFGIAGHFDMQDAEAMDAYDNVQTDMHYDLDVEGGQR